MAEQPSDKCVSPAKGPILTKKTGQAEGSGISPGREEQKMGAKVGKPAPDFEAAAFINGGFKNIKLSDYKGKWVVLCFYPGDFTFV